MTPLRGHHQLSALNSPRGDMRKMIRDETDWISKSFRSPITAHHAVRCLVSHWDETAPHAHFTCPAYDMNGLPLTSTVKRGMLRGIQTLTAEVMGRHCAGIERGKSRYTRLKAGADYADTVNKSVKELHETLPADIEAKQTELDGLISDVAKAQVRYNEMEGRVEKLATRGRIPLSAG